VRLEALGQLKNPKTSSGIEPVTFRLVAQIDHHKIIREKYTNEKEIPQKYNATVN
jgi:hypothetical protein